MITVATWNVNSVKARLGHLLQWLREDKPDIVLLQELKCIDEAFPKMEVEELGYNIATHGQKTYNGVAILSKFPLEDIRRGLPGDDSDLQARYIEAVANIPGGAMRVASVYVVNGQTAPSEKFDYKLHFLDRFHEHVKTLLGYGEMLVIGGDYNIAPTDADVHNPKEWEGSVLTHDEVRTRWRKIINAGMADAQALISSSPRRGEAGRGASFAQSEQECPPPNLPPTGGGNYTWWDYRAGALARDDGLRIDHLLLSMQAVEKLSGCHVKKELRMLEKASDHAPVVGTFNL